MEVSKKTWHYWLWSKSGKGRWGEEPKDVCQYVRGLISGLFNVLVWSVVGVVAVVFGIITLPLMLLLPFTLITQLIIDGSALHLYTSWGFPSSFDFLQISIICWFVLGIAFVVVRLLLLWLNRDQTDSIFSLWWKGKIDKVCYKVDVVD